MLRRRAISEGSFDHVRHWVPALLMLAGLLLLTILIVANAPGT